jgi:hypothetical protein
LKIVTLTEEGCTNLRQGGRHCTTSSKVPGYSLWCFFSSALYVGRGVLQLYCVVDAAGSTSLCTSLVIGFLHCMLLLRDGLWLDYLDEIYLRKVVGFFPHLGFSQDKYLVFFCSCFMWLISQYMI